MARSCAICGKVSMGGFNPQSSGMNRVRAHRRYKPNLQPLVIEQGPQIAGSLNLVRDSGNGRFHWPECSVTGHHEMPCASRRRISAAQASRCSTVTLGSGSSERRVQLISAWRV